MITDVRPYRLNFKFEAGTSRGVLTYKDSWFVKISHPDFPQVTGLGECGPLPGLSPDLNGNLIKELSLCSDRVVDLDQPDIKQIVSQISPRFPAVRFAFETALMDLQMGGKRIILENPFSDSSFEIPINGLVWMGEKKKMQQRIASKISQGFTCIKIKVGAINLLDEIDLLKHIRSEYSSDEVEIRLDANGAFEASDVMYVLKRFSNYDIHSVEQPIRSGQWESMSEICSSSPIPIALDEELIGVSTREQKIELLEQLRPQYIILKPSLVGGLLQCEEWIELAERRDVGWWMTSALESNIGLNAIAQFVSARDFSMPQGLGTGQLFHNNIPSPLYIDHGHLVYRADMDWDVSCIFD